MIQFSYTGAQSYNKPQSNPLQSLGGYISSSILSNGLEGNIFQGISLRNYEKGSQDVRCIALKNIGEDPITSLTISLDETSDFTSTINLGLVQVSQDNCGDPYFELLPSPHSLPTFTELIQLQVGEDINIDLSTTPWAKDKFLGLWIERKISKSNSPLNSTECEECNLLYSKFTAGSTGDEQKEIIKLVFDFN